VRQRLDSVLLITYGKKAKGAQQHLRFNISRNFARIHTRI
jgi:hypothetical protein